MTKEEILNRVLADLELILKVDNEEKEEYIQARKMQSKKYNMHFNIGYMQGRINLCEDLIRFISDNLEKGGQII